MNVSYIMQISWSKHFKQQDMIQMIQTYNC